MDFANIPSLTTYQEVALWNLKPAGMLTLVQVVRSYPKFQAPEDVRGEVQLKDWWEKHWNQEKEVLHQVMFNRIGKQPE